MDMENIYNDESLPSDENIPLMNREYNAVLADSIACKIGTFLTGTKRPKSHICMLDFDNIAELYGMEKDSILALERLKARARLASTYKTIDDIKSIKSSLLSYLERLYIKGKKSPIPYTPHIVERPSYSALYSEIERMECRILAKIDSLRLSHMSVREQSAAIMTLSLKI